MGSDKVDKLKAQGWVHQFSASGSRLQEAVENYRMLGFEVKTVPVRELPGEECSACFADEHDETMMIFTRKKSN
ncbi:MAG: hypothetical protein ACE5K8_00320 [Candidatus Zixiibacteriota bacterium]